MLLFISNSAFGLSCGNDKVCSKHFQDLSSEPVGCDQTTMWTFASWSKLSCALSCLTTTSCAVFTYSGDVCSVCRGKLIQNLTFGTSKLFSWPYQYQDTDSKSVNVSSGINIGALVHLSGFMYGSLATPIVVRLNPFQDAPHYPFCLHFNYTCAVIHSTESPQSPMKYFPLSPGTIEVGSTHVVDILVAKKGYQVFLDQSFIGFEPHDFPYSASKNVRVSGNIDIDEWIF
ncbi:hypothetical protein Bpfe_026486 [Biomphalaria pfeifferi]|uniref:Galectin n=1 Tax=Biomphalaria pfeifferi TaxID=112525 RepID=A0AAD8AX63_BIOPF|nr:hypothetical protein Bpfe_026486 [Biomphalaria pfeifferi]